METISKTKRKTVSKKTRFEVFKRDSFKCQYCGAQAPDVLLELDHIKPVVKGGKNTLLNYITSCQSCNRGKSARELSDDSVLSKQKKQLDDLNERRNQIEMMLNWQDALTDIDKPIVNKVKQWIESSFGGYTVNEHGAKLIKPWIKKYSLEEIKEAIDICATQYLEYEGQDPTSESWNKAFDYIPRICAGRKRTKDNPQLAKIYYIRAICKNRFHYFNDYRFTRTLQPLVDAGINLEDVQQTAKSCGNWSQFISSLEEAYEDFGIATETQSG